MSDVLRLSCSIEDEIGRNAMKSFASLLEKVYKNYHNILDAYLMLRTHLKDSNVKIPFSFPQTQLHNIKDDLYSLPTQLGEVSNEVTKQLSLAAEKVSTLATDHDSTIPEPNVKFNDSLSLSASQEIEIDELCTSPVLGNQCANIKNNSILSRIILESPSESNPPSLTKKDSLTSKNNSPENTTNVSMKIENISIQSCDNNDEIACTPVTKVPKRLGVSKLYNVDTTLLSNGKKLKQSRLMFFPTEPDKSVTHCEKYELSLKSCVPSTSKNNIQRNPEGLDEYGQTDEEIIESSPKRGKLWSRNKKYLKLKENNTNECAESDRENIKPCNDSSSRKCSNTKLQTLSMKKDNFSPNKHSTFMCTPVKEDKFCLDDISIIDCDILPTSQSLLLDVRYSTSEQPVQKLAMAKNDTHLQKRKLSASKDAFSICNDETFFALEDKNKGQNDKMQSSVYDDTMFDDKTILLSPPTKRSFMSSFDMVPEKKEIAPSKSKVERAKMTGISCWECKQYYEKLGLSEKEMQARQNQCSRHRNRFKQRGRESTPEGFWDPLFPATMSSTYPGK